MPTYERDQVLRPQFRQGIDVQATPDDFGAAIGRGTQQLAQGGTQLADAMQAAQHLADETIARDATNQFIKAKDARLYGSQSDNGSTSTGYLQTDGQNAINGVST